MTKGRKLAMLRLGVGVVAVVLIAVGVAQGEMQMVFSKAAAICLECIGLGGWMGAGRNHGGFAAGCRGSFRPW